jgi:hypothetical protein
MAEVAFQIAGLEVLLRADDPRAVAGLPFGGTPQPPRDPGLVIDFELDPTLGPPYALDHPAFARRREGGRLIVERADCNGYVTLDGEPVTARFRVPEELYAREACMRVALSIALPRHDALILHASAARREGGAAHVFTGVSGAGKSTIAQRVATRPGWRRLADELLVVARTSRGWNVHVPPLVGVDGLPIGEHAPLASIELLAQAPAHARTRLAPANAMRELLRHVVVYAPEAATADRVLAITSRLVATVPCHRLEFRDDASVADLL